MADIGTSNASDRRVSPFWDAATEGTVRNDLKVADCTLRDGEQQAGVVLRRHEKVEIARLLDACGIHEIEAGTPAVSAEDADAVAEIADTVTQATVSALSRATEDDIDGVAATGADLVRLSMPISTIQRDAKFAKSDAEYFDQALRLTAFAKERGLGVVFSPYDTTRADLGFLETVLGGLTEAGTIDRIRLVDTAGCGTPPMIAHLVRTVAEMTDVELEIHCHDDLGLAVANTLSAALAGVHHLSVTVNGIGERSGNAALEEVLTALRVLYDVDLGIELDRLVELSALVERHTRVNLHQHKAVVGKCAFSHESGMVVQGVIADPFTAECYRPELVGQDRRIVIGKMSGRASVEHALQRLRQSVADDDVGAIVTAVREFATEKKRELSDAELQEIVSSVSAGTSVEKGTP